VTKKLWDGQITANNPIAQANLTVQLELLKISEQMASNTPSATI
jgi:hypothetical protein